MRRGVLTAGTWCVDINKSIPLWPSEDTMTTIADVDRQGGGSGCNMAIDLKRLDPDLPVETMGLVGDDDDGRFLIAECDRYGVERSGLRVPRQGATAFSRLLQLAGERPAHAFLRPRRGGRNVAGPFRLRRRDGAAAASRPARRAQDDGRALGARIPPAGRRCCARARAAGLADQSRNGLDRRAPRSRASAAPACRISIC